MKLKDLHEQPKEPSKKGTYAGVKFDTDTNRALHKYIKENKIPNSVRPDRFHSTLLYSRKHLPNYKPAGKVQPPMVGNPSGLTVWETNGENSPKTKCLIFQYDCPALVDRHKSLMKEHEATYDYDEFRPHITLSYDIGDMDVNNLPPLDTVGPVNIVEEYGEDLDLDWARNKGVKKGS